MVAMASKKNVLSCATRGAVRFLADERGATAIEYALIASGIGAAVCAIVFGIGTTVTTNLYNKIAAMM
jgi:pilus assembly protein Flp/PilA